MCLGGGLSDRQTEMINVRVERRRDELRPSSWVTPAKLSP